MNRSGDCTCAPVHLNTAGGGARDWRGDCPEHGVHSEWYRTVGRDRFQRRSDQAIVAQALAALARSGKTELAKAAREAVQRLAGEDR